MGKTAKKKTTAPLKTATKRSVRKTPVTLSYSKTIIITMGVLFLTLFLFVYEAQRIQEQRSSAQITNCDIAAAEIQMTTEENNLLQLINQYRTSKGAPPLNASTGLSQSAAWMSNDMKSKNLLSHTDSLGRGLEARISQCGYNAAGTMVGENVARGTGGGAQQIFDLWKTSTDGHNEEMLRTSHKVVGIAQNGDYWTADFGGAPDGAGATSPGPATVVTPSFFPLAPCPSCTQPAASTAPATGGQVTDPQPVISTEPVISAAVEEQPVISGLPAATTGGQGGLMDLLNLILQFLKQLLEQLFGGGNGGDGDGNGGGSYNGGEEKEKGKSYNGEEKPQGGEEKEQEEQTGEKGAAKNKEGGSESKGGY